MRACRETVRAFVTVAVAALAVAVAGGCDGSSSSSADARLPDAPPIDDTDAGEPIQGSTAWELVSCGLEDADAGPDGGPDFDAAPGTPDAGDTPPEGLGDPCCDPEGGCNPGLECISSTDNADDSGSCRPVCTAENRCPHGGRCANFGGQKVCIEASDEGQECAPELCSDDTICVLDDAETETATCHKECVGDEDCDEPQTCQTLTGSTKKACI
jgi:hypothetical protein